MEIEIFWDISLLIIMSCIMMFDVSKMLVGIVGCMCGCVV